ncbi:MAG: gamma-glutamyltransferase, partial [Alphaproteobacteria bacterium]
PGMVSKHGRAVMPFGVMGGHFQPVGQSYVLSSIVDHGLDPQEAINLARLFAYDGVVEIENGISDVTAAILAGRGHQMKRIGSPHGGGQAIWIDHETGTMAGGSDPRKDGLALGF